LNLTKTPYLVLFIILGAIGVGTASALITITFEGLTVFKENVQFDKDVNIDGIVTGQAITDFQNQIDDNEARIGDLENTSKYGLVFTAGGTNYPLGSTNYLGLGDVFTISGDAAFFIPFDSTITDIRAGAANTSPDTTVTYTVKNLGGFAVSFGCSGVGTLQCSNTGSVDVNAGQKLFIEITGGCVGTCPTNISDVRVSIGLLPR